MQMYRTALSDCDKSIEMDQNYLQAYILKSKCFKKMDQAERSQQTILEGLKKEGDLFFHQILLGMVKNKDWQPINTFGSQNTSIINEVEKKKEEKFNAVIEKEKFDSNEDPIISNTTTKIEIALDKMDKSEITEKLRLEKLESEKEKLKKKTNKKHQ